MSGPKLTARWEWKSSPKARAALTTATDTKVTTTAAITE
jgi:hypothetical protein